MSPLSDRAFNSKATSSSDVAGAEGWSAAESKYPNFVIASDPTAPQSPSHVGQFNFPTGFAGGSTPGEAKFDVTYQGYRQMYVSTWVKVSPTWQGSTRYISSFFLAQAAYEPRMTIGVRGTGSGTLVPAVRFLWTPNDRIIGPNLKPDATLPRGQWQHWELAMRINSPGNRDGELHWWVNGVKIAEYHDIAVIESGERYSWDGFLVYPLWGGAGDIVSASGMSLSIDDAYIAGSKANTPLQIPAGSIEPPKDTTSSSGTTTTPTVARVVVTPSLGALQVGGSLQLSAAAADSTGAALAGRTVSWTSANAAVATVSSSGLVTAVAPGTTDVTATVEGVSGKATISVTTAPPTLQQLSMTPSSVTIAPGGTQQFALSYQWSDGSSSAVPVTYTATGGTVSATGLYTAGTTAGTFRVIAREPTSGLADTSVVTIPAPPAALQQITMTPAAVTLAPGATQQFSVAYRWSDGSSAAVPVSYSATGGSVSGSGLYTAGSSAGTYSVVVRDPSSGRADTSAVTISAPPPPPPPPSGSDAEPLPTDPGAVIVFRDDFENYTSCGAMLTRNGGQWLTGGDPCDASPNPSNIIFPESGTGYVGSPTASGGRSARFTWPISTSEQYVPLDHVFNGSQRFSGQGQTEYYSYMYRAPGFVYYTTYPRVGKKQFLIFLPRDLTYEGRVTTYSAGWSLLQSVGGKIDTEWDSYPPGVTTQDAFNKTYITDGRWHRYTIMRKTESRTGAADGVIKMWMDGYLVSTKTHVGTYDQPASDILLAGTFNGGSSRVQTEYFDNVVAWHY